MRVIFQCYQCKIIVQYDTDDMDRVQKGELPYPPKGWKHRLHIADGFHYWLCGRCAGEKPQGVRGNASLKRL